jgi:hypothetical protein
MSTSALLYACLIALPQGAAPPPDPATAAEKIRVALDEAVAPALSTIDSFGSIADHRVTKAVGLGLRHKDPAVQGAAIKALRYNKDKSAVSELLEVRRQKSIIEDAVLGAEYYLALGQHADIKALPVLAENLNRSKTQDKIVRARVLALGRMRTNAAIEALIRFSVSSRRRGQRNEVNLALTALTGEELDRGGDRSRSTWTAWWSDHKKHFKVAVQEPELPKRVARNWERIWREPLAESGRGSKPRGKGAGKRAGKGDGKNDGKNEGKTDGKADGKSEGKTDGNRDGKTASDGERDDGRRRGDG